MENYKTFSEFYPFYLSQHSHPVCRKLHVAGSIGVLALFITTLLTHKWKFLVGLPVVGYGFAWVGHFCFEKNKPATFQYPFYSLMADWVMLKDTIKNLILKKE